MESFGQRLMRAMAQLPGTEGYQDRIAVKANGITRFLTVTQIDWIEAAGAYVTLHVGDKEFLHGVHWHPCCSSLIRVCSSECIVPPLSTLKASCSSSLCRTVSSRQR
jgi:hypothetical protein